MINVSKVKSNALLWRFLDYLCFFSSYLNWSFSVHYLWFFFQAEDGIRVHCVTGFQTCALPISSGKSGAWDGRLLHLKLCRYGRIASSCRSRSEERRVGKECRSRRSRSHEKKEEASVRKSCNGHRTELQPHQQCIAPKMKEEQSNTEASIIE